MNGKLMLQNVYICIPTGTGKTTIMIDYHKKNRNEILLVLVPVLSE